MTLRWKKQPRETGLRAIGAGPQSSDLHDGVTQFATVSALRQNYVTSGWYWVAGWSSGVPYANTCHEPHATEAEAKAEAMAYVKKHLAARAAIQPKGEAS